MPLTKPNQELRSNLKAAAFAIAMVKIAQLHEHVDRLTMLADEVKAGKIVRG